MNQLATFRDVGFSVAKNAGEVQKLRAIWQGLQSGPNSDIDHFLHVIAEDPTVIRPHVTILKRSGKPVAIAVGRIEQYEFTCKFGYRTVCAPSVRALAIIYDGLLGDFSRENSEAILASLLRAARQEHVELIRFSYLRNSSPMYALIREAGNFLTKDHLKSPSRHWRMELPEKIEDFYQAHSRKHRYWMRRIIQILNKDFEGQVRIKVYANKDDVEELITNGENIAAKTYQWGLGQGFKSTPEMRSRFISFAERGQLRSYVLYIENKPRSFWTGQKYGNTYYLMHTGYDPEFKKYELGTILFIKMIEDLINNTDVDFIDFGFSDQPYKARFGNENWDEETIHIFALTWRGLWLNAIRTIIGVCWTYSAGLLIKIGLKDRLKRRVRDRLIRGLKKNGPKKEIP